MAHFVASRLYNRRKSSITTEGDEETIRGENFDWNSEVRSRLSDGESEGARSTTSYDHFDGYNSSSFFYTDIIQTFASLSYFISQKSNKYCEVLFVTLQTLLIFGLIILKVPWQQSSILSERKTIDSWCYISNNETAAFTTFGIIVFLVTITGGLLLANFLSIWRGTTHKVGGTRIMSLCLLFLFKVGIFPFIASLKFIYGCSYAEKTCWKSENILLLFSASLIAVIYLIFLYLSSIAFFAVNPQKSFQAQTNARYSLALIITVLIDLIVEFFLKEFQTPATVLIITGFGLCNWLIYYYFPFYNPLFNFMFCFLTGTWFGGNITAFFMRIFASESHALLSSWGLFLLLGIGFVTGIISVIILFYRLHSLYKKNNCSSWEWEIKIRILWFPQLSHLFRHARSNVSIEPYEITSERYQENSTIVLNAYYSATDECEDSAILLISWGTYVGTQLDDYSRALHQFKEARKLRLRFDIDFLSYARVRQFATDEQVEAIDMSKMLNQAQFLATNCCKLKYLFWSMILKERMNMRLMTQVAIIIDETENGAIRMYRRLTTRFPYNADILRSYAQFLEKAMNKEKDAQELIKDAEELEQQQQFQTIPCHRNHHRSSLSLKNTSLEIMGHATKDSDALKRNSDIIYIYIVLFILALSIFGSGIAAILVSRQGRIVYPDTQVAFDALYEVNMQANRLPLNFLNLKTFQKNQRDLVLNQTRNDLKKFDAQVQVLAFELRNIPVLERFWLKQNNVELTVISNGVEVARNYTLLESTHLLSVKCNNLLSDMSWLNYTKEELWQDEEWKFIQGKSSYTISQELMQMTEAYHEYHSNKIQREVDSTSIAIILGVSGIFLLCTLCLVALLFYLGRYNLKTLSVLKAIPKPVISGLMRNACYNIRNSNLEELKSKVNKKISITVKSFVTLLIFVILTLLGILLVYQFQHWLTSELQSASQGVIFATEAHIHAQRAEIYNIEGIVGIIDNSTEARILVIQELSRMKKVYRSFQYGEGKWKGIATLKDAVLHPTIDGEGCDQYEGYINPECGNIERQMLAFYYILKAYANGFEETSSVPDPLVSSLMWDFERKLYRSNLEDLEYFSSYVETSLIRSSGKSSLFASLSITTAFIICTCIFFPMIAQISRLRYKIRAMMMMIPSSEIKRLPVLRAFVEKEKFRLKEQKYLNSTKSILQAAGDAVVVFDKEGTIKEINSVAEQIFEVEAESVMGHPLKEIFREYELPGKPKKNFIGSVMKMPKGTSLTKELELTTNQHSYFPARVSVSCGNLAGTRQYAMFVRNLTEQKLRRDLLVEESKKSEKLLLNILPQHIAKRLKSGETNISETYDNCTILFAEITGFSKILSTTPSTEAVAYLNQVFKSFDQICEKNGVEKIKTIGECYMAAGGLDRRADHALAIMESALEMLQVAQNMNSEANMSMSLRFGINTGRVVGGVIGEEKFQFDIWGDTVNVASRMQSNCSPNKIQISRETYELVYANYQFQERNIFVKGKGEMKVYLCLGRKTDGTIHLTGGASLDKVASTSNVEEGS